METLSPSVIVEFILYNNWANQRILEACRELDEHQLAFNPTGAYGTIRATLVHLLKSEAWYVSLLTGKEPKPSFGWDAQPGLTLLTEFSKEVGDALLKACETVRPADVVHEEDKGQIFTYKAIVVLIQIINHGIEHRTNITTSLAQMNLKPPQVDGWGYLDTHNDRFIIS